MNSTVKRGIPGLRGQDRTGTTVPDLQVAIHFFVDVIGCELWSPKAPDK